MVSEFVMYMNQNMSTKKQIAISFIMLTICIILIKINQIIDEKKRKDTNGNY